MSYKDKLFTLIPFYVACCLYKQFVATKYYVIPKLLHCQGFWGLFQHNIETLAKCKLLILDLNVINRDDF